LQPLPIRGIGVSAVCGIPKGKNPLKTLPKYSRSNYARIIDDELDALPLMLSGMIKALFVPTGGRIYIARCGTDLCTCPYI
jgi:hypothetical protein